MRLLEFGKGKLYSSMETEARKQSWVRVLLRDIPGTPGARTTQRCYIQGSAAKWVGLFFLLLLLSLPLNIIIKHINSSMLHPAYVPVGSMLLQRTSSRRALGIHPPTRSSASHIPAVIQWFQGHCVGGALWK